MLRTSSTRTARLAQLGSRLARHSSAVPSVWPPGYASSTGSNPLFPNAPSPLQEFSVVYTDRALNHMSAPFKRAMLDIGDTLKHVYKAKDVVIIPGSGTYAMEAVARQFAKDKHVLVLRNGYFSYRWTQIFEVGKIPQSHTVLKAQPTSDAEKAQYAPAAIDEVIATIKKERPAAVFAPHVETSTGMLLPDYYIKRVADAIHEVGGLMVLDCIASGTVWVDMEDLGVDALISAPQKGWTGPSCAGLVMLSPRGTEAVKASSSNSFVCDVGKWLELMESYEAGGFMYHATMPTDALVTFRNVMFETQRFGFEKARTQAWELGRLVRALMSEEKGLVSVAAPGFQAPGVVVVHTDDKAVAGKFIQAGTQIAAGVPFMIGEPKTTNTFRIGLFGLDKLKDPMMTAEKLKVSLDAAVPDQVKTYLSGYIKNANNLKLSQQ